jgi:ribosomal protein L11 methyltransferase
MWKLSIETTPEAEDAVSELLGGVFRQPVAAYTDLTTGGTTVTLYCDTQPDGFFVKRNQLKRGLARIKRCRLDVGPARIRVRMLRRENWAESWKRHFKPFEVGRVLLVKPSWSKRRPRLGQSVVVLDPGLSFGTGHHPTTLFCLSGLVRRRLSGHAQAFLDLGTGSGILAIAAAKLGFSPVAAVDCDAESVRVAQNNARVNGVSEKVSIAHRDLTELTLRPTQRYDLICANLDSNLLVTQSKRIVGQLKPRGTLRIAGILRPEFALVAKTYRALGFRLVTSRSEMEWRSGLFVALH